MKKLNVIVFVLIFSLAALLEVSAQEATFDEGTLTELKKSSAALMDGRKMRFVSVEEESADEGKTSVKYFKSTREFLPPDRRRYVYETRTARGIEREEFIDIGEKSFVRRDGGEWELLVPSGNGVGSGMGNGSGNGNMPKTETTTVRTLTKNVKISNQTTDLYKTVVSVKFIYRTRSYTNIYTESYWFDNSGKMIKSASESKYGDAKTVLRSTEDYEYDPNLKIEAPVIKKKNFNEIPGAVNTVTGDNQPIIVTILPKDEILINAGKIAFNKLGDAIEEKINTKTPDESVVFIVGDKNVGFQKVVDILKLGRQSYTDTFGLTILEDAKEADISKAVRVKIILEEFNGKIKPNPLFLRVALGSDGKITLNSKPQTPESLETELFRIFEERKKEKIYRNGSDEVDATVFVKSTLTAKYGDVLKLIEIVKTAGANPIAVEIDKLDR